MKGCDGWWWIGITRITPTPPLARGAGSQGAQFQIIAKTDGIGSIPRQIVSPRYGPCFARAHAIAVAGGGVLVIVAAPDGRRILWITSIVHVGPSLSFMGAVWGRGASGSDG